MVFSSLQFIFIFMPVFFILYYISSAKMKNAVLLLGSLCFYFVGTLEYPEHFILFTVSILSDYFVALAIDEFPKQKKIFFILGLAFHLVSLCIFKYSSFALSQIQNAFSVSILSTQIALPIGISFYTFQGISYIADVYKGKTKSEKNLLDFAVYISMFPQLIAGPIVTYNEIKNDLSIRRIEKNVCLEGLGTFVFGLGLKVLLANPLGKMWSQTQTIGFESISTPLAWLAIAAYSFQIYFDFFGYSLMAVGLGKMLGFNLPKNFNHPYTAVTMTQFWRQWHITLGSWFREYVYIPLGGNRKSKLLTVRNLFVVWLLTGIWHGAGYNFILWGFVLFVILVLEKYLIGDFLSKHRILGHLYMALLIALTWAIFAIDDFEKLGIFFSRLFPFGQSIWSDFRYDYLKYLKEYALFFVSAVLLSTKLPYRLLKEKKCRPLTFIFLLAVFVASTYCMYQGFDDPFLYFRF